MPHQVVVRLLYRDQFRDTLEGVFGFTVDMPWVRKHYFPELTGQVARIGGTGSGLALAVVDADGKGVAQTTAFPQEGPTSRRTFPMMFFDPLLVVLDPPGELRLGSMGGRGQRRGGSDAGGRDSRRRSDPDSSPPSRPSRSPSGSC